MSGSLRLTARKRLRTLALLSTGLGLTLFPFVQAQAQTAPPAPVRSSVDANGVNLFNGTLDVAGPALMLGTGGNALTYKRWNNGNGWSDNVTVFMNLTGSTMVVAIGGASDSFAVSGTTYTATEGNGSTLTYNGTTGVYTYTRSDGTIVHFDTTRRNQYLAYGNTGLATDLQYPNG